MDDRVDLHGPRWKIDGALSSGCLRPALRNLKMHALMQKCCQLPACKRVI